MCPFTHPMEYAFQRCRSAISTTPWRRLGFLPGCLFICWRNVSLVFKGSWRKRTCGFTFLLLECWACFIHTGEPWWVGLCLLLQNILQDSWLHPHLKEPRQLVTNGSVLSRLRTQVFQSCWSCRKFMWWRGKVWEKENPRVLSILGTLNPYSHIMKIFV